MLILQRKKNQKITITGPNGQVIELLITDVSNKNVKIGFTANKEFVIIRNELMEGGKQNNS